MKKNNKVGHSSKVILEIKLDEYNMIAKKLNNHLQTLHRLVMLPLMKKALIKDIYIIKTVLEKSEKGVK